jgi:hypothetical protein
MRTLERNATEDTAKFVNEYLGHAMAISSRTEFWSWVLKSLQVRPLSEATVAGELFLEFGVHKGESLSYFAKEYPQVLWHGFDSFEGLKEDWHGLGMGKGTFYLGQAPTGLPSNTELVAGWFDETLPQFLLTHPGSVRCLHLDADTYDSTIFVLRALSRRIVPGTWIIFDEFFNYNGWRLNGEYRAFQDWIVESGVSFEYRAFSDRQVAVEVLDIAFRPSQSI